MSTVSNQPNWHFLRAIAADLNRDVRRVADYVLVSWLENDKTETAPPVKVFHLARWLGVTVRPAFSMATSGMTSFVEQSAEIVIRSVDAQVHQRFTLAHELGHLLLEEREGTFDRTPGKLYAPEFQPSETRANAFAAELLMPARWLVPELRESPGIDLPHLARRYHVSTQAMTFRLRGLGFV